MVNPPRVFRKGERLLVVADGRRIDSEVVFASENGASLVVYADAIIAGFVGAAPLVWMEGRWETLSGTPVELEEVADAAS